MCTHKAYRSHSFEILASNENCNRQMPALDKETLQIGTPANGFLIGNHVVQNDKRRDTRVLIRQHVSNVGAHAQHNVAKTPRETGCHR